MAQGSPLAILAAKYRFVNLHQFAPPCGKDGFLAVNSLLAFAVLLARSYTATSGPSRASLPGSFKELVADGSWTAPQDVDARCGKLWDRETLIVLHGPSTLTAAIDIESKLTEAALGSVQLADYRHFAHGRHHWIAKRKGSSAVLALVCDDDRWIAESMLGLLPSDVTVVRIDVPYAGWLAGMSAMARGFFLAASAGRREGLIPATPASHHSAGIFITLTFTKPRRRTERFLRTSVFISRGKPASRSLNSRAQSGSTGGVKRIAPRARRSMRQSSAASSLITTGRSATSRSDSIRCPR